MGLEAALLWSLGAVPLRWESVAGCPAAAAIERELDALVGEGSRTDAAEVTGRLRVDRGAYVLHLEIARASRRELRELRAHDCSVLARAGVLVAAVTLDALGTAAAVDALAVAEPGQVPEPGVVAVAAARGSEPDLAIEGGPTLAAGPPPTRAAAAEGRAPARRSGATLAASAGVSHGMTPGVAGGIEGELRWRRGPVRLAVAGFHWFSRATELQPEVGIEAALEDHVHDVFLAILRRLPERDPAVPMRAWVVGVARNVGFSHRRAAARQRQRALRLAPPEDPQRPDEELERRQAWQALSAFLDDLGPEQREVFVMVEVTGMRISELAATMGMPANTSDGILVALAGDTGAPGAYYSEVRAYSSSLELSWSQQFPGALISDLEDLGGGEYLAAGSAGMELAATLWRLSCCSASSSQAYLQGTPNVWVVGADLHGDGIFLAVGGLDQTALLHVPLELGPATELGTELQWVYQTASTPTGTVVLRVDAGDFDGLDEIGPDGPMGGFAIDPGSALVGKGDELTLMSFDEDRVEIQAFGEEGDAWVTVPTPGFAAYYDDYVVDRHERVVLIHREEEPDGSASATLVEFDDDGIVARTLRVPHLQYDGMTLDVVTVGEDHAIYLALTEQTPDADRVQYIHRIAPL